MTMNKAYDNCEGKIPGGSKCERKTYYKRKRVLRKCGSSCSISLLHVRFQNTAGIPTIKKEGKSDEDRLFKRLPAALILVWKALDHRLDYRHKHSSHRIYHARVARVANIKELTLKSQNRISRSHSNRRPILRMQT